MKRDTFYKIGMVVSMMILLSMGFLNNIATGPNGEVLVIERRVMAYPQEQGFSEDALIDYLREIKVKFPEVVFAQALLETGNFKSSNFKRNSNLFGMKRAGRRPTTAAIVDNGYAVYKSWQESVLDYALYQSHYLSNIKNQEDYLATIGRVYAEDPKYLTKIKIIIDQKFGSSVK